MKFLIQAVTAFLSVCRFGVPTTHADTFGSGGGNGGVSFTIDFVAVGNIGNQNDANDGLNSFGVVNYNYRMSVTEVPQDWITKATTLGMSNVTAGAWTGNQPAADMTWYEAAAFVNFLNTSTGHQPAYNLNAELTSATLWSTENAWPTNEVDENGDSLEYYNFYRHKNAYYFLPSEDEWYKAAYHKNNGVEASPEHLNYWDYATGSNDIPGAVATGKAQGTVVYDGRPSPAGVDNNGGLSPYGTRGQNGNVDEWLETPGNPDDYAFGTRHAVRGGSSQGDERNLRASEGRSSFNAAYADAYLGLRVASIPEPSSTLLVLSAVSLGLAQRRRR